MNEAPPPSPKGGPRAGETAETPAVRGSSFGLGAHGTGAHGAGALAHERRLAASASSKPAPATPAPASVPFLAATHEVLFAADGAAVCDVCGEAVETSDDEGYAVPGRSFFLSCRGDRPHYEERPLCADCAAALGMSALARWEIEEEEG